MRRMEGFLLPLSARRRRPFQCNTTCLVKGRRHAGRACLPPCRPVWRGLFLFFANCPAPPCPKPALCWEPVAPAQARHRHIFCGAGRCFPAQNTQSPRGSLSACHGGFALPVLKNKLAGPLPLRRHGAGAWPGAASAHLLTRGAFGAARWARLQPAARWRRASASCAASWAYSGLSNRLA